MLTVLKLEKLTWDVILLKLVMDMKDDGHQSLHTLPWVQDYQLIQQR